MPPIHVFIALVTKGPGAKYPVRTMVLMRYCFSATAMRRPEAGRRGLLLLEHTDSSRPLRRVDATSARAASQVMSVSVLPVKTAFLERRRGKKQVGDSV